MIGAGVSTIMSVVTTVYFIRSSWRYGRTVSRGETPALDDWVRRVVLRRGKNDSASAGD